MPKFKEIKSGLVYEFLSAWDVAQMRKHPEYMEIVEAPPQIDPNHLKAGDEKPFEESLDGDSAAISKRGIKKATRE